MNRNTYYEELKVAAREIRVRCGLSTPRVRLSDLRKIYKEQGIKIDLWKTKLKGLRGAYFCDESGASVMLDAKLPEEPRIFTMAHELKHHLFDRLARNCFETIADDDFVEIGAEVFAGELIFPEADFSTWCGRLEIAPGACSPEDLVRLKRETKTTLSYAGLVKRATRLGFAPAGSLAGIHWKKLEEQVYGEPIYKRILRARQARGRLGRA